MIVESRIMGIGQRKEIDITQRIPNDVKWQSQPGEPLFRGNFVFKESAFVFFVVLWACESDF